MPLPQVVLDVRGLDVPSAVRDVVGVDLSTKNMAYTKMVFDEGWSWVSTASFDVGQETYCPASCLAAYELAEELPTLDGRDMIVYLEAPIVHAKFASAILPLAGVSGAFQAGCTRRGLDVQLVAAPAWKKTACGSGHATKEDVRRAVAARNPGVVVHVERERFVQDCYDSYGIAVHGCEAESG